MYIIKLMIRKLILSSFLLLIFQFIFSTPVNAVCPVCTAAVGVGVGLSRWLGVDDTITGIWVGALIWSSSFWMANWMERRKISLPHKTIISAVVLYLFIFVPFQMTGFIGHPINRFWGIDKLVLGTVWGSTIFILGVFTDRVLRVTHEMKVYFPYQKVIVPVGLLVVSSVMFYFITKPSL